MTCPSCGRIAGAGLERCPSCNSILAVPTDRPAAPTPIVRAPTNRGEMAQRAMGIFARSLVPHRSPNGADPTGAATGLAPAPPPPGVAPPGGAAPAPPATRHVGPGAVLAPSDPQSSVVSPAGTGWSAHLPVPATFAAGAGDVTGVTSQLPPVDVTVALPAAAAPGSRERQASGDAARAADEPTEERPRAVRPNVEAPWPTPPGPWSGRRTSES